MRWRSRSMSSTLIRTVSPIATTSEGWLTWLQESSEMWIRPSIPSRSTKAPKSTMLEILPSTTWPGSRRPRICSRTSLRSSSRTARRERTTLLRLRLSSMTLHSSVWPMNSSRLWTRRMSTSEAGRKPRTPRSRMRPPLTTSMTLPSTGSPESAAISMRRQAFSKRARFLERIRRPSASSLVRTSASTSSPSSTSSAGIDRLADRELVGRDDSLGLVADVDEDLVFVDPDDLAVDDVALVEGDHRRRVVGDDLAVDLEQQAVGALDGRCGRRRGSQYVGRGHGGE